MTLGRQTRKASAAMAALGITAVLLGGCQSTTSKRASTDLSYVASTSGAGETHTVTAVVDGDTLKVDVDGQVQRVRVLGINAPELSHEGRPAQCGASSARTALDRMIYRKGVVLQRDSRSDDVDRYGRLLRYVSLGGADVGLAMIRAGHASEYHPRSAATESRARSYQGAQATAERAHRGQWASCSVTQETKR